MRILLTGATGYIGRRLKERLLGEPDVDLRLFVRNARKVRDVVRDRVEIFEGDTFHPETLAAALDGVAVAYYLIHSMGAGRDFAALDRQSAENFRDACVAAGVRRIVYLGGLGVKETASEHLRSRLETGEILSARADVIRTIWVRAGVIIGSGSASFEIIRNLVQKTPMLITPRWVRTRTEPIAVEDVLSYLAAARDVETPGNLVVDVGAEVMTFADILAGAARVMGLRRWLVPLPFLTPRMGAYGLVLLTPVPFGVAAALVEGLKSETVKLNDNARRYFPQMAPRPYEEAFGEALAQIQDNQVLSRWCDAGADAVCEAKHVGRVEEAVYADHCAAPLDGAEPARVFAAAAAVGGERGWMKYNLLWRWRGLADKLLGGPGTGRGRRDARELRVGDALDFWKVADVRPGERLLLAAQMRLPGEGWLEFAVGGRELTVTAYFYPRGLWGRLYWYAAKPFHGLALGALARGVVGRARTADFE
jgi:uncharacterized protein YbjT (DUF2867 family)